MGRDINSKIKMLGELAGILEKFRQDGKRIVHCHGVFDLLHPGHIRHFEMAKKEGDILVVTVTKDEYVNKGPGRPVFNHNLRAESIAAIECVDYVAVNEWPTAVETIRRLKPHLYVKGSDYVKRETDVTAKIYEEEEAVKSVGGMLHFTDDITFSSSSLINTYMSPYPEEAKAFLTDFKKRYTSDDIINILKAVEGVKALVIGDVIIDEYHYCMGMGKSQKDNIVAAKFLNSEIFAGGILATANHLAGFCKDVTLACSVGGANDCSDFVVSHLKPNIKRNFYHLPAAHTVIKRRFVDPAFMMKLFEVCYLEDADHMPRATENVICGWLDSNLKRFDMVLVGDFGHGFITPRIVNRLCRESNFLAVNVQTNSANIGFNLVTKFPRADYVCIDEPEIRFACHDRFANVEKLIGKVAKRLDCDKIAVTRGHKGSLVYSSKEGYTEIPVFSKEVLDRIGAGDAYLSITAPCAFKDNKMEVVGFIGNAVGAMKVLIVGNRSSVEPVPLIKYITTLLK